MTTHSVGEMSHMLLVEVQTDISFLERNSTIPNRTRRYLPVDPAFPLLRKYPDDTLQQCESTCAQGCSLQHWL